MKASLASKVAQRILADYITNGRLKPGEALPSMRALEEQYGASVATIAHAIGQLHAQGAVRKSRNGRACVAGSENSETDASRQAIGMAFPSAGHAELHMRILRGVERATHRLGFHMVVAYGQDYGYESEHETVARLVRSGCKAVILNPGRRTEAEAADDYLNYDFADVPLVLVDMGLPQHRRSQVVFDNFGAGYEMTRLLISEGHSRIAFMAIFGGPGRLLWPSNHDRWLGYMAALNEAGLEYDPDLLWQIDPTRHGSLSAQCMDLLMAWLKASNRPTAVLGLEDSLAVGLVEEARELGIDIPEDLLVTGFDNTATRCPVRPSFLTTLPDFALAGEKAVELAVRELRGDVKPPVCYMLPVPVVRRMVDGLEAVPLPVGPASLEPARQA